MRRITYLFMAVFFLNCFWMKAQTTDDTGLFEPVLTGTEIVYAELSFTDGNNNGSYDATFCLADPEISSWDSYSAAIMFYSDGIAVRDQGSAGVAGDDFSHISSSGDFFRSGIATVPGKKYQFWITLNVASKEYKVDIKEAFDGSAPQTIVSRAGFRNASVTELKRWAALHNQGGEASDFVTVHNVTVVSAVGDYPANYETEAALESIEVSAGTLTPEFSSSVTSYSVTLPKGTTTVNVKATPSVGTATVTGDGDIDLTGANPSTTVQVTSKNGSNTSPQYTINFDIEAVSKDATLSDLQITLNSQTSSVPGFSADRYTYYYVLTSSASIPVISATTNSPDATTSFTQVTQVPGKATVEVTAESGDKQIYAIYFGENIIDDWDAGIDPENANMKPNELANPWLPLTANWNTYNGGGGVRFQDLAYRYANEATAINRPILTLRWESGVGMGSCFALKASLESCKNYKFSGGFGWNSNGSGDPIYTVTINKSEDGAGVTYGSGTLDVSGQKGNQILNVLDFVFAVPETGDYYLTITSRSNEGIMGAIADLVIMETDEPLEARLELSTTQMIMTDGVGESKSFTIMAVVDEPVNLTAPAGFTLSKTSIPVADFDCVKPVEVTVNLTDKNAAANGKITVTTGTGENMMTDTINLVYLSAAGNNLIPFAMGAGSGVTGAGTEPSAFGWSGASMSTSPDKEATFTSAASSAAGNRYISVSNYMYNPVSNDFDDGSDEYTDFWNTDGNGWVLLLRWDGNDSTDSLTVFNYPVQLEAGKTYKLSGKYAWHANGDESFLSFGINTQPDNSGDMLNSVGLEYLSRSTYQTVLMDIVADQLERGDFLFTATVTGTHYLTVYHNPDFLSGLTQIVAAFADLAITDVNASALKVQGDDNVKIFIQDRYIYVEGADEFKVYSVTGIEMNPKSQLSMGVYIISVNGNQYKVLVK